MTYEKPSKKTLFTSKIKFIAMSSQQRSSKKQNRSISRRDNRDSKFRDQTKANQNSDFQPKILRKQESVECEKHEVLLKSSTDPESVKEFNVKKIQHSIPIVSHNRLDTSSLRNFLDPENSNFYVIGVVGMKNAGKSTLMNLLATGKVHGCQVNSKNEIGSSLFSDFKTGNGIEAFITEHRVILLDSAPVLHNTGCREFIVSEADYTRQLQILIQLCHELIILHEPGQIFSLARMLIKAKLMMLDPKSFSPGIILVENRVQFKKPYNPLSEIAKNYLMSTISDSTTSFELPDFNSDSLFSENAIDTISQLRDDINTRKELKAFANPSETEKTWWDKFCRLQIESGHFIQRFEAIRDKFYQANEAELQA